VRGQRVRGSEPAIVLCVLRDQGQEQRVWEQKIGARFQRGVNAGLGRRLKRESSASAGPDEDTSPTTPQHLNTSTPQHLNTSTPQHLNTSTPRRIRGEPSSASHTLTSSVVKRRLEAWREVCTGSGLFDHMNLLPLISIRLIVDPPSATTHPANPPKPPCSA
jgi:hypothetical protein